MEKWEPWPYLLDLIDIIQEYDLIYILKASQLGVSWLMAILNLWLGLFGETAKCLLFSQGQREARELLAKVFFIYRNLPDSLKLPIDNKNRDAFVLKDGDVEIMALPSVAEAGHGFQGTMVTRDELARHEFARENFRAVARSGAKMIELSTANKGDPANYFGEKTEEFYRESKVSGNKRVYPSGLELYTIPEKPGQCLVFLSWKLRPTRDANLTLDEWRGKNVEAKFTAAEIEEQYPTIIEDVFKASVVKAYFNSEKLEDMGYDICNPIKQDEIDTHNGLIRVYKLPQAGRRYIIFTDPSDGGDPFVTGVADFVTEEVVCSATGNEIIDRVAKVHDYLVREYNDATNTFEYTGSVGGEMWRILDKLKTPNQAPRRKPDGKIDPEKKGQWVSNEHRLSNFGYLSHRIAKRLIVCHDREFIQQAKLVKRDKTQDGKEKIGTDRKMDFDWVLMMTGLWQLHKYAPQGDMRVSSFKYG